MPAADLPLFASASVEMWQRAINSFLVSVSLTKVSRVWASVSAYYSSHYVVRAYAHMFGFFSLNRRKSLINVSPSASGFVFKVETGTREHDSYWLRVGEIIDHPLFGENADQDHRSFANYRDHIDGFEEYKIEDAEFVRESIAALCRQDLYIPKPSDDEAWKYPQVALTQQLALHRICHFRDYVDSKVDRVKNRFWSQHRDPQFARTFMKYRITGRINPMEGEA